MRHRMRGRTLGRNASHRRAMFRNMASSLIRSVRVDPDDKQKPKVPGRIVTTVAKAKELRPIVEKLVTMACKALEHEDRADEFDTSAERGSPEWKSWRESDQWNQWNQAIAPAVALRRRAFSLLRDKEAVDVLFGELAEQFEDRPGGYTRVVRLPNRRLGDAGQQAFIEFVGENDRVQSVRRAPVVLDEPAETATATVAEPAADETASEPEPVTDAEAAAEEATASDESSDEDESKS